MELNRGFSAFIECFRVWQKMVKNRQDFWKSFVAHSQESL